MQVQTLHSWQLSPSEAIALQRELARKIDLTPAIEVEKIHLIAGVDVSANRFSTLLTAGIVVWDKQTGSIVDSAYARAEQEFPYIPGLLSFREIPILIQALTNLHTRVDAILVDGQGIAHPRRLGIAAHLGLLIDVPTVGVAKSRLVGTHAPLDEAAGSTAELMLGHDIIGTVVRSKTGTKPLYVSPGNHIDHASALKLVQECMRGYRLPEPTRLAHLYVNEMRQAQSGPPLL